MDGTLFGSIIELITRLDYDEKEKLILISLRFKI